MQGEGDYLTIIDGPYGQGERRTARIFLALSAIHQKPVTLQHVRANRNNPRLRPHPLKEVEVLTHVTGGKV